MAWQKTAADRQRDAQVYGNPEYQANRKLAMDRARGRCEECGKRAPRLQCDHVIPVIRGGGHELANLRILCAGPGSCHARKTAREGRGYRGTRAEAQADPDPQPRTKW